MPTPSRMGDPVPRSRAFEDRLTEFRFAHVHRHVPALHATAQLNLAICVYVMWRQGIDPLVYAWTPLLTAFSLRRVASWRSFRRSGEAATPEKMQRVLVGISAAAVGSVLSVSLFSAITFALGLFGGIVVIPVSLAFGTFAIAHCMASMRSAAMLVVVAGIVPSAAVMLVIGSFEPRVLSLTMLSVGVLNIGFLREYHRAMITRLELAEEVENLAQRDPLTGLLNRRALFARIADAIQVGQPFSLAIVDLDGFKQLNDTHGHLLGDEALKLFAQRLCNATGEGDEVARLGGDEFVLLLRRRCGAGSRPGEVMEPGLPDQPVFLPDTGIAISGSCGVAHFPDDGMTGDELYAAADARLYTAKRARNGQTRKATPANG